MNQKKQNLSSIKLQEVLKSLKEDLINLEQENKQLLNFKSIKVTKINKKITFKFNSLLKSKYSKMELLFQLNNKKKIAQQFNKFKI